MKQQFSFWNALKWSFLNFAFHQWYCKCFQIRVTQGLFISFYYSGRWIKRQLCATLTVYFFKVFLCLHLAKKSICPCNTWKKKLYFLDKNCLQENKIIGHVILHCILPNTFMVALTWGTNSSELAHATGVGANIPVLKRKL